MTRSTDASAPGTDGAPWTSTESGGVRRIGHSHRWLVVVGAPLAAFGVLLGAGPWFLPGLDLKAAAPVLAVGSLMGTGMVLLAIHVTFHREETRADRHRGVVDHIRGVGPFTRRRQHPLSRIRGVECRALPASPGGTVRHVARLVGDGVSIPLAASTDAALVRSEAQRWASFLQVPLGSEDTAGSQERLRREHSARRPR